MEQEENWEFRSPLPILPRLNRIDRLLQLLEEKHCLSARHSSSAIFRIMESEDQCKTLSSALEEVHHKGTLMERIAVLENRVLQLSLEIDIENTLRYSSSTILAPEQIGHGSGLPKVTRPEEEVISIALQEKQDPIITQESASIEACIRKTAGCGEGRRQSKTVSLMQCRKWVRWFRMGC